jgi:glycosyl transferase family 2
LSRLLRIEVVVPAARGNLCQRLVDSLALQTRPPDLVSLIGNEVTTVSHPDLDVRRVHYATDYLSQADVCLRRNIGIYFSEADIIIFQDDDQLAPPDMVESAIDPIQTFGYVWGHHRYIDFGDDPMAILNLPPDAGISREQPANAYHRWQSCYAGMFGAKRDLLMELQGFDMVFEGRIGNEDQQLGHRLFQKFGLDWVFIYEPPFAWHPTLVEDVPKPPPPPEFDLGAVLDSRDPIQPFDPSRVQLR